MSTSGPSVSAVQVQTADVRDASARRPSGPVQPRAKGDIVFYDAKCGLCDSAVQIIVDLDQGDRYQLAPLQGALAQEVRNRHALPPDLDSILLVTSYGHSNERVFAKAAAVGRIAWGLGGLVRIFGFMSVLPRVVGDWAYDLVARRRHRLFPPPKACRVPTPEVRKKFIGVFD